GWTYLCQRADGSGTEGRLTDGTQAVNVRPGDAGGDEVGAGLVAVEQPAGVPAVVLRRESAELRLRRRRTRAGAIKRPGTARDHRLGAVWRGEPTDEPGDSLSGRGSPSRDGERTIAARLKGVGDQSPAPMSVQVLSKTRSCSTAWWRRMASSSSAIC